MAVAGVAKPSFHARLPSFPRKRESRTVLPHDAALLTSRRGIPAYAGMTVGDGGVPAYAGMTVKGRPGRTVERQLPENRLAKQ